MASDHRRRMGPVPSGAAADPNLASDTFDRADNTALGSTDGGSLGPLAWTESCVSIATNRVSITADDAVAFIDVLDADVVVSATVNLAAGKALGVVARYSDANNFLFAYLRDVGGDGIVIYSKEAGSYTVQAVTAMTVTAATDYAVAFTVNGTAISATVDGANLVSWTSSFNQAATKVGLYSGNANGSASRFDNFTAAAV